MNRSQPAGLATVQHVSIPESEQQAAHAALGGTCRTGDPRRDATTRVVSVMIYDHIDAAWLDRLPGLEAIITRSDGHDHLPMDLLLEHNIDAFHLAGYATDSVADLTVAHILGALHRLPEAGRMTAAGTWDRNGLVGRRMSEVTVGLLGVGRIGSAVAQRLEPFDASVQGHDIAPGDARVSWVDFDRLLATSDVLSLHVPWTPATDRIIDADAVARMPHGACLVNTARGALIDQEAVAAALRTGRLAGYAADVMPGEPEPDLRPFQDMPTASLTPHLGAHNRATHRVRYETTQAIADAWLRGDEAALRRYRVSMNV